MTLNIENLSETIKKNIAGRQYYKCANRPNAKLKKIENYTCPLWAKNDENKGSFDQSGYEIDFIALHLHALCNCCT